LGDAFLVWDHTFLQGMASFGIGHTFYISAFGFRPLNLPLGLFLYGLGCLVVSFWLPQLETWFAVCVAFYTMLLITTAWRAMVRVRSRQVEPISFHLPGASVIHQPHSVFSHT